MQDQIDKISKRHKSITSDGERLTQGQINSRIKKAKKLKVAQFKDEHTHLFCEDCGINEMGSIIDLSHEISIKEAKETNRAELCYTVSNLKLRCRKCHRKHDKS